MSDRRVLESWKAIAAYLGRTEKTCRNWEHELGLPVHRLAESPKAHVFAYADELDRWKEEKLQAERARAAEVHGFRKFGLLVRRLRKPAVGIPAFLVLAGVSVSAVWFFGREARLSWATNELLPRIAELVEEEEYFAAFKLAQRAERYIGGRPGLQRAWPRLSSGISILTNPPGAMVSFKDYRSTGGEWESLGRTPLEKATVPFGFLRWKFELQGYATVELALDTQGTGSLPIQRLTLELHETAGAPGGMVWVPGGFLSPFYRLYTGANGTPRLNGYWIDRYEVTNRKFKRFVEAGGYANREFWKQPFIKDGKILPWEEAMKEFRDKTGSPGPAPWELGTYPEGQEDQPVGGVSWYEAAAYAEFAGKVLPTIHHWLMAANFSWRLQYLIPLSNFSGRGPARVGSFQGMSECGVYDMLGNVKEWCWNETGAARLILGGAWDDPAYMASVPFSKSPFDRGPDNGFRCVQPGPAQDAAPELWQPIVVPGRDYSREAPVDDRIFEVFRGLYARDKTDPEARLESRDGPTENWTREKITFNSGRGTQRMTGYLFLPKAGTPPFATVIYQPSGLAFSIPSSDNLGPEILNFLLVRGRAVFYPVFLSTYERRDDFNLNNFTRGGWRDHCFQWSQDLGASLDYLETRPEINKDQLAYYGYSWGGLVGPILLAVEPRIKAAILEAGGFMGGSDSLLLAPEADPFNFAPRVRVPILMLNGRYDISRRMEEGQDQLFRRLGTPPDNKFWKVYETDHHAPRLERIKEVTAFLDKYLGPAN